MMTDDDMREIEAAVGAYGALSYARTDYVPALAKLLALIRQKLPQTDAEHERMRRGFAFGNTNIENASITREMVDEQAEAIAAKAEPMRPYEDVRKELGLVDAEHERAVEAWRKRATTGHLVGNSFYHVVGKDEIDEALRLMRARPAIELTNDEREAMNQPGVYAIDGRILGVVDATATPVGRMVRMSARPAADKAALQRLREKVDAMASAEGITLGEWRSLDRVLDWIDEAIEAAERANIA